MSIEIKENFQIAAPIEAIWQFLLTPESVVNCLPGGSLEEIIDENSFYGSVKFKIGAITARYKGKLTYTKKDNENFLVEMLAEAKEKGGGTVSGTITTKLTALPDGKTEVQCDASGDLTGRILQVGRGMIEGVAAQIIKKYITNVKQILEVSEQNHQDNLENNPTQTAPPRPEMDDSINIIAIAFVVMRNSITRFFRRLFRMK